MATIKAPGQNLRQFYIAGEVYKSRDDEDYYLIFSRDGRMYVRVYYSPNKQYGSAWWGEPIAPADFANHTVDGVRLDRVVAEFLDNKLPTE
jgi:hypothetical protein